MDNDTVIINFETLLIADVLKLCPVDAWSSVVDVELFSELGGLLVDAKDSDPDMEAKADTVDDD